MWYKLYCTASYGHTNICVRATDCEGKKTLRMLILKREPGWIIAEKSKSCANRLCMDSFRSVFCTVNGERRQSAVPESTAADETSSWEMEDFEPRWWQKQRRDRQRNIIWLRWSIKSWVKRKHGSILDKVTCKSNHIDGLMGVSSWILSNYVHQHVLSQLFILALLLHSPNQSKKVSHMELFTCYCTFLSSPFPLAQSIIHVFVCVPHLFLLSYVLDPGIKQALCIFVSLPLFLFIFFPILILLFGPPWTHISDVLSICKNSDPYMYALFLSF